MPSCAIAPARLLALQEDAEGWVHAWRNKCLACSGWIADCLGRVSTAIRSAGKNPGLSLYYSGNLVLDQR